LYVITHHYGHAGRLHDRRQTNHQTKKPPPILAQSFPAAEDHQVGDYAYALHDDREGHEEADGAPHRAEIPAVAVAVFALREALAGIREGGTAAVETVGVMVGGLVVGAVSGSFCDGGEIRRTFSLW
jgi:hypothetical protein